MVEMQVKYTGSKNCILTHVPSQAQIQTDAPKDNHGRGQQFSPTDLLAVSLLSCILTTIAIKLEPEGYHFENCYGSVKKEMQSLPRKIKKLSIEIHLNKNFSSEQKTSIENAALNCPVKLSLNSDILISSTFIYDL